MTKKKAIIIGCSVAAAVLIAGGASAGIAVACTQDKFTVEPTDKIYTPTLGYTAPTRTPDTGMKIDGVLDEAVYKADGHRWYNGVKVDGEERATVDVTTVFGEHGIYVAYDVTELTNSIYYNPNRSSWVNSGVEMYFALDGTTNIDGEKYTTFEVDMECSGNLSFKRRFMSNWIDVATTYDKTPVYAAALKGGNYNEASCYGYSGELFIPYDYLEYLGVVEKDVKPTEVYINPVLITSYSYEGTLQMDRNWHNLAAADTDGDGWGNPSTFFHFNDKGFMSYDINTEIKGEGNISTAKGYKFAVANNSLTLNVEAKEGYTLKSLTINDEDYKGKITYKNYNSQIYIPSVTENLNIKAEFEEVTATPRLINGNVIPQGVASSAGIKDMQVKYFDGFKYTDLRTVNGAFAGYIPEGEYALVVVSKSMGFEITRQNLTVSESNAPVTVNVNDTMYGDNRAIRFDGIEIAGGSATVDIGNPVTSEKFVFSFRIGTEGNKAFPSDNYVEDFRLIADNGDYITFACVKWGGTFGIKIYTRGHADQDLGKVDTKVNEAAEANHYIDFVMVRDGKTLTVYAYDVDNQLHKVGSALLYDTVKDTQINTFVLWARDGSVGIGAKVSDCVIYQGTTDLKVLEG